MPVGFAARGPIALPAAVGYEGPGDAVPGAAGWWGLRAYSAATAAASANCVELRRDGSSPSTATFTVLPTGDLDVASIAAFLAVGGATNLFVRTVYDQSGNGRDVIQTTTGDQPKLLISDLSGLPVIDSTALGGLVTTATMTIPQPITVSVVALFHGTAGRWAYFGDSAFGMAIGSRAGDAIMNAGIETPVAISSAWHRVQTIVLDNAGNICIDGVSSSTLDPHSVGIVATSVNILRDAPGTASWNSKLTEIGLWGIAFSGAELTDMDANQEAYWGL